MGCICEQLAGSEVVVSPTCIGDLWIFRDLKPAEIQALALNAERQGFERGAVIVRQGERAERMFLIKAGRVKLSKISEDGTETTLDLRKAGDFLGENILSEDLVYPLSAVALEKTLICGFSKGRFEQIVLEHPNIGLKVIKNLSERIHSLTDRVGGMSLSSLEERLYTVLANVAREHGRRSAAGYVIQFPLTHEELSFLVGAHRVSITRALKHLKDAGRIQRQGKTLTVTV